MALEFFEFFGALSFWETGKKTPGLNLLYTLFLITLENQMLVFHECLEEDCVFGEIPHNLKEGVIKFPEKSEIISTFQALEIWAKFEGLFTLSFLKRVENEPEILLDRNFMIWNRYF